jgi:Flp pilus assembly protein CpaB
LLLAVLAGAGVFFLGNLTGGGSIGGGPTTTVVIAKQAIGIRHTITDADLDTAKVSGSFTSANNTYANKTDVLNLIAEIQITKGSVITSDMLAKDVGLIPAGAAPAYLPLASGYVAMTISTGELQGVAGHITLGDYFTVIASGSINVIGGGAKPGSTVNASATVSKTVFTNVRVIGLGPASANVQPAGGATTVGGTATISGITSSLTIELTQCDAEYFTWFINNMTLKYTVESFHDYLTAPTAPDPTCPTVLAAQGVSNKQVDARYHFSALT